MTPAEKIALDAQIELAFADNTAGDITPAVTRAFLHALVAAAADGGAPAAELLAAKTLLPLTATRTANHVLELADAGCLVPLASSNPLVVTLPDHNAVALPVGSTGFVRRTSSGAVSLAPALGVQLLPPGVGLNLDAYGEASWHKIDLNTYWLKGDLG